MNTFLASLNEKKELIFIFTNESEQFFNNSNPYIPSSNSMPKYNAFLGFFFFRKEIFFIF